MLPSVLFLGSPLAAQLSILPPPKERVVGELPKVVIAGGVHPNGVIAGGTLPNVVIAGGVLPNGVIAGGTLPNVVIAGYFRTASSELTHSQRDCSDHRPVHKERPHTENLLEACFQKSLGDSKPDLCESVG